jgi:hypothetical protein
VVVERQWTLEALEKYAGGDVEGVGDGDAAAVIEPLLDVPVRCAGREV